MLRTSRVWLAVLFGAVVASAQLAAAQAIDPAQAKTDAGDPMRWFDVRLLGLEGQGWTDTESPFDRLPKKAKEMEG